MPPLILLAACFQLSPPLIFFLSFQLSFDYRHLPLMPLSLFSPLPRYYFIAAISRLFACFRRDIFRYAIVFPPPAPDARRHCRLLFSLAAITMPISFHADYFSFSFRFLRFYAAPLMIILFSSLRLHRCRAIIADAATPFDDAADCFYDFRVFAMPPRFRR